VCVCVCVCVSFSSRLSMVIYSSYWHLPARSLARARALSPMLSLSNTHSSTTLTLVLSLPLSHSRALSLSHALSLPCALSPMLMLASQTTFDKGFARYITCWVALSDAHPGIFFLLSFVRLLLFQLQKLFIMYIYVYIYIYI
jgi:hypothetical protein